MILYHVGNLDNELFLQLACLTMRYGCSQFESSVEKIKKNMKMNNYFKVLNRRTNEKVLGMASQAHPFTNTAPAISTNHFFASLCATSEL